MQVGIELNSEPIRVLDHAVIQANPVLFMTIGRAGNGLRHPARMILVQNFTNADLAISDQTSPDYPASWKYVVAARQGIILDCTTNKTSVGGSFCYPKGTVFSAATIPALAAPTTGAVYLSAIYAMG